MASAKKTAAAKKATRTPLVDAPKPGGQRQDPRTEAPATRATDPRLDPQNEEEQSLADLAANGIASPPTPTQEQLLTANDGPGAGGLAAGEAAPARARTKLKDDKLVKVSVPKAFNLDADDNGTLIRYDAGTEEMPKHHAEHWYAQANGVEIVD